MTAHDPVAPAGEGLDELLDDLAYSYLKKGEGFMVPGAARLRVEAFVAALLARVAQLQAQVEMMDACLIRDDSLMERAEKAEHEKVELFDAVQDMKRRLKSERERADRAEQALGKAEAVFTHFATVPCLHELLGEDSDGCGCMGCEARAFFAARTPSPTTTEPT